jgi:hypothetical protein
MGGCSIMTPLPGPAAPDAPAHGDILTKEAAR